MFVNISPWHANVDVGWPQSVSSRHSKVMHCGDPVASEQASVHCSIVLGDVVLVQVDCGVLWLLHVKVM